MLCCTLHSTITIRHHVLPCDSPKRLPQYWSGLIGAVLVGLPHCEPKAPIVGLQPQCCAIAQHSTALPVRYGPARADPTRPDPTRRRKCDSISIDSAHQSVSRAVDEEYAACASAAKCRTVERLRGSYESALNRARSSAEPIDRTVSCTLRYMLHATLHVASYATCCTLRYMLHPTLHVARYATCCTVHVARYNMLHATTCCMLQHVARVLHARRNDRAERS